MVSESRVTWATSVPTSVFLGLSVLDLDPMYATDRRQTALSVLTAIFQVNMGYPVFIEAKDDGGGGDNWTTGAISRAKL